MRRMRMLSRFSPIALLALALLGWPLPSHAYRMIQANNNGQATGRQTSGFQVQCDALNGFAHWNSRNINWYHNTAGQGLFKNAALQAALASWTNVPDADHVLSYAGTTTAAAGWDGLNTFVWGATSAADLCGAACHAITVLYLASGQVIQESDIVFNDAMTWKTDGTSTANCLDVAAGTSLDTQAIAMHELGHSLGIHHTEGSWYAEPAASATMRAQSCSFAGRSLSADDMEALKCSEDRYPISLASYEGYHEVANCGTISGWSWRANRPNRPTYVEIWDGNSLLHVRPANLYRSDLQSAGKGTGEHAFVYGPSLWDGLVHRIHVKHSGTSVNLAWSPRDIACGASMFSNLTPTDPVWDTGGQVYTVGTQFSSSLSGQITHLRFYWAAGETGSHTAKLWTDTGVPLASVALSAPQWGQGWTPWGALNPPINITAGTRYRVSVQNNQKHAKTGCGINGGLTSGPLTAHSGFWVVGDAFPTGGSCSNFFVDVLFSTN